MRGVAPAAAALALLLVGCGGGPRLELPVPAPTGPDCRRATGELRAGVGRADITPPPGLGLQGYGPGGRRALGWRRRLHARALVIEDADGERVAFLAADLPQVSAVLHRETARRARMPAGWCLGADRLVVTATHTHAGPGHFFLARMVNQNGSSVPGYDSAVVRFLADRFAAALGDAVRGMRRAEVAWGETAVWGLTRNRSLEAHLQNRPLPAPPFPPPASGEVRTAAALAVDPTLAMLRVDTFPAGSGDDAGPHPAGALSVFGVHGTAVPPPNRLYDPDLFGPAERGLERRIDAANRAPAGRPGPPRAVHLVVNGASGDVSPAGPPDRLCPRPSLRPVARPPAPRAPPAAVAWDPGPASARARCLAVNRAWADTAGLRLARRAGELWERLATRLTADAEVGRAFETLALAGRARRGGNCARPYAGTGLVAGAEDGRTRYHGWKLLGLVELGFVEGGAAVASGGAGCQGRKRIFGGSFLQDRATGPRGFPHVAQLTAARVGGFLLGAVPWEVTAAAGYRLKDALRGGAREGRAGAEVTALATLSQGYLHYLTTPAEYDLQHYEGASNLYGPGTLATVARRLRRLSREAAGSGAARVDSVTARPGPQRDLLPRPGESLPGRSELRVVRARRDTVVLRWTGARPGGLAPHLGPVLSVWRRGAGRETLAARDDDGDVSIRALGDPTAGRRWEARWTGCRPGVRYRVELVARPWPGSPGDSLPARTASFSCSR